jgi:hypothetical integral membrane protein (TIGR02206 family)
MVIAALAAVSVSRHRPGRCHSVFAATLAGLIFAAWAGEYIVDAANGTWSVKYTLPLQLTDAVSAVAILALLTRRQLLIELTYFWALTASLQATLTPDLYQAYPSVYYFTYFTYHVGVIVAALFLVFGLRRYPRPRALWRVYGCTLLFAAIAAAGDLLTGGNYMYLRAKPVHNSLLSVLGPWPWYIVGAAAVGLAMLFVLTAITNGIRAAVDRDVASERAAASGERTFR